MKFTCPECRLRAASGTVQCSWCQQRFHPKCAGISIEERKQCGEWFCLNCQSLRSLNEDPAQPLTPLSLPPGSKPRSTPKSATKPTTPKSVSKNQASQVPPCVDCVKHIKQLADLRAKYNSQLEKNSEHEVAIEDLKKQVDIFLNDQKIGRYTP